MIARSPQKEIMDGELGQAYSEFEYERMLAEIDLINRLSRGYSLSIRAVAALVARRPGTPVRVLDIGFGSGDTLRELRRWARAYGVELELFGIDLNPRAQALAESRTPSDYDIHYMSGNVFDLAGFECDIMINSLMMHHLNDDEVVRMLSWMTKQSRVGWFVNDLHRHPVAYHFIRIATRLFRFGRLVAHDAPLSIARAFRRADWEIYLRRAEIPRTQVNIRWHWPFRYGVSFRSAT